MAIIAEAAWLIGSAVAVSAGMDSLLMPPPGSMSVG